MRRLASAELPRLCEQCGSITGSRFACFHTYLPADSPVALPALPPLSQTTAQTCRSHSLYAQQSHGRGSAQSNGLYSFPQQPVISATKAPFSGKRNTNATCTRNKFLLTASVRQIVDNICCVFPLRENVPGADATGNRILLTVEKTSSKPVMRCNKKHPTASQCGHLT